MPVPLALDVAPAGQAEGWRRHEDIIDALPYVDTLSAEEKARVDVLIKEEVSCVGMSTHSFASPWTCSACCGSSGTGLMTRHPHQ